MKCASWSVYLSLAMLATVATSSPASAAIFELREDGGGIFGRVETVETRYEDTLIELARRYSLGYEELTRVNVGVDPWLPGAGTQVLIPGQRLLPPGPREGIVVNLPEHRLYYFPKPKKGEKPIVMTFPVSVGKMDWRTPLGTTRVVSKRKNPAWFPPRLFAQSIWRAVIRCRPSYRPARTIRSEPERCGSAFPVGRT